MDTEEMRITGTDSSERTVAVKGSLLRYCSSPLFLRWKKQAGLNERERGMILVDTSSLENKKG